MLRAQIERIGFLSAEACAWVDQLPSRLRLDFQRGYETVLKATGIHLKGPVMKFDRQTLIALFSEYGADVDELKALSDDELARVVDGFALSEGDPLWVCDKVFSHDSVRFSDGRLIASVEVEAPETAVVDHEFRFMVPTSERILADLKQMCEAEESYVIERQDGCFVEGASIGLADWGDAVSRKVGQCDVILTRYKVTVPSVVHEFWQGWDSLKVEARLVDSCVYLCGDVEIDALGVAAWLEGCRFPAQITYLKTDGLDAPTQHHS
jgi:hypothetical protein